MKIRVLMDQFFQKGLHKVDQVSLYPVMGHLIFPEVLSARGENLHQRHNVKQKR
jgi:hypothetical protein